MNIKLINEGLTQIRVPEFEKVSAQAPVFYNPAMELNRDLSILALQEFQRETGKEINICDAFGGSGIRGIRYSKEIDGTGRIVVNDISSLAVQYANENAELNEIIDLEVTQDDANLMLRKNRGKFDVVDIDPFGTPSFFIESAANSLKSNSMLCITATDTSALCGTYKEPCVRKYNSMPLKTEYCHENGIRILAAFVARTFAKYKKLIEVQFSHSSEHYMRLYFKIGKGAKETDASLKKNIGFIAHCKKCLHRQTMTGTAPHIPENCPDCGEKFSIGGPLWLGNIQNKEFIEGMIKQAGSKQINQEKKALKLLEQCQEEADMPVTFFDVHVVCKKLKISAPSLIKTIEQLENEKFNVSRTHYSPTAIKTDAPLEKIEEILINLVP